MRPEFRILTYLLLVVLVYLAPGIRFHLVIALCMVPFILRMPLLRITAGWLPILVLFLLTFLGNLFGQPGRIVFFSGFLKITDQGIWIASLRSVRLLLLIAGVKLLMSGMRPEDLVKGLERLCRPAGRLGIPVSEFFHVTGLTIACFPRLKQAITERYREMSAAQGARSVNGRIQLAGAFLMPLFVESLQSPEKLFIRSSGNGKDV